MNFVLDSAIQIVEQELRKILSKSNNRIELSLYEDSFNEDFKWKLVINHNNKSLDIYSSNLRGIFEQIVDKND